MLSILSLILVMTKRGVQYACDRGKNWLQMSVGKPEERKNWKEVGVGEKMMSRFVLI
jgi:hypothetical protein